MTGTNALIVCPSGVTCWTGTKTGDYVCCTVVMGKTVLVRRGGWKVSLFVTVVVGSCCDAVVAVLIGYGDVLVIRIGDNSIGCVKLVT